jgi:hypothetical protein
MILHSNPWQDHNGASHRKNLDTPPLKGWCAKVNGRQRYTSRAANDLQDFGRQ